MSKDYSKGYAKGEKDGESGTNRAVWHAFARLLKPDQLIKGAEVRHSEFMTGQRAGFEDKVRTINVNQTTTTTPKGGSTMANTTLGQQIELMNKLKSNLGKFQEELQVTQEQYRKTVEYLHAEGLIGEIFNDFMEGYADPTCSKINGLVSHIEGNDLPAVEKVIRYLESYNM